MRMGFISRAFPFDLEKCVHGLYKRMSMFIEAMKIMETIDMLFYVSSDLKVTKSYVAQMEERLQKHWGVNLRLDICPMNPAREFKGRWEEYSINMKGFLRQPPYSQIGERRHIDAIDRVMSRNPDAIFVHRLPCMIPLLLSGARHRRVYFDLDDIELIAFSRSIKLPPWWKSKFLLYFRLPGLWRWERRAIAYSSRTFVCSEIDKETLSRFYRVDNVRVIPNAVNIQNVSPLPEKPTLMLLGTFNYQPNIVAADYLIARIWPRVLASIPDARLLIAGNKCENIRGFGNRPSHVDFLGFVADLEELYRKSSVACCPILSGGGTRIKILEAAAFGKPVVSTTVGAEGLGLRDGAEIIIRDDPRSFADACIRLLRCKELAASIGGAARRLVSQRYERNRVIEKVRMHISGSDNFAN